MSGNVLKRNPSKAWRGRGGKASGNVTYRRCAVCRTGADVPRMHHCRGVRCWCRRQDVGRHHQCAGLEGGQGMAPRTQHEDQKGASGTFFADRNRRTGADCPGPGRAAPHVPCSGGNGGFISRRSCCLACQPWRVVQKIRYPTRLHCRGRGWPLDDSHRPCARSRPCVRGLG